ncbi:amino acid ABC transporter substrate-binding protein [Caenimonas sedimenti]|uniref:Amino acid ABC transporter substrate-binding protein n=1 Tax=Caenimonas sedimenti TaxID=2596921 RepID=A0A562ZHY0_9BURK|nr:ABC transporter substrate-binding protein [Caenimonas sedimenti]TWO68200.1 amino acid ABC transporter substrate-binding protein [Caenimonas sedimenti]
MTKTSGSWLRCLAAAVCLGGAALGAFAQAQAPMATAAKPAASVTPMPAASAVAAKPAAAASGTAAAAPTGHGTALVKVPDGRLLAPDIARIVTRGELVVAMLGVDTPPFFYEKNGELVGLEVDLAKAMAKELGVKVRFNRSAKTFNSTVDLVARGEADMAVSKISRTLARSQIISFTQPYLTLNHALILNRVAFAQFARERPVTDVIRRYNGTIGVIAKSSFQDYAGRYFPKAKVKEYPGWPDVLKALEKGEVMAAYRDEFEIKRILKTDPTSSLTLRTVTLKDLEDTLGIAIGINDRTLLAFANEYLTQRTDKLNINKVLAALEN